MKVTLLSYTPAAADLLIFAKSTRLNLTPNLMDEIAALSPSEKAIQLDYIANTIKSSWEFVDYVFLVEGVSRAYTHQQVRTRAASYAQQTMRILDVGDFDYIFTEANLKNQQAKKTIEWALGCIKKAYRELLAVGQAPEDARGILPTNISTNILCKFNLRTFSDLVKSRSGGRTQAEYRAVVQAMAGEVLKVHPWAAGFIYPQGRDFYTEVEKFAAENLEVEKRRELLKILDKMK